MQFIAKKEGGFERREIKDSTEFSIQTLSGFKTKIPNFLQRLDGFKNIIISDFKQYMNESGEMIDDKCIQFEIKYQNDIVPTLNIVQYNDLGNNDQIHSFYNCDILTGQWWNGMVIFNPGETQKDIYTDVFINLLSLENEWLSNRLKRLEVLFDHISEKSSTLNEFMKLGEQAIVDHPSNTLTSQ